MMDLSLATIEQIIEELSKRPLDFALIVSPQDDKLHSEGMEYQVHSSIAESPEENSLQEAVYCFMATLELFGRLAEHLDQLEDDRADDLWRWRGTGQTLLRDIFATAEEWEVDGGNGENS